MNNIDIPKNRDKTYRLTKSLDFLKKFPISCLESFNSAKKN